MTHEDVIEEYRIKIGAKKVHVSYDPSCDPEDLRESLLAAKKCHDDWQAIPEVYRLRAQIKRLRELLRAICRLGQSDIHEFLEESKNEPLMRLKRQIFSLTDLIPDVSPEDTKVALELMKADGYESN